MAPYPASEAKPNEHFTYRPPQRPFKSLTPEEVDHFLTHGWLKVENALNLEITDRWVDDLWARVGFDKDDKSTWNQEYVHLPFHRLVRYEEVAPKAFEKIVDLIGGEENWDPVRERWVGDNFVCNFGSEERSKTLVDIPPKEKRGWHCDNDWFRQFLDSSGVALTVMNCFTAAPLRGGGTWFCEEDIPDVCKRLYDHPEGLEPGSTGQIADGIYDCTQFSTLEAKRGDVIILHGLLPHIASYNYIQNPRVMTNTHVTLREPLRLARPDNDYTLIEQFILRALDRESIPEFKPTRERAYWYPRNNDFKYLRLEGELEALKKAAKAKGLDESSVDSLWLKGPEAKAHFEKVNGLYLPKNESIGMLKAQHPL